MVFSYRILRQADGILLATGTSQNVFADAHTGKPIRLDAENFAKLQRLWKEESR